VIVVVTGSRFKNATPEKRKIAQGRVWNRIAALPRDVFLVTGGARGVDTWAERARVAQHRDGTVMPAKWRVNGVYNPVAGFERNRRMLDLNPEFVLSFWDGISTGTLDTMEEAKRRGITVEVDVI